MHPQGTIRNGERLSTSRAFLEPVKDRPNLHISLYSMATKLNVNKITGRVDSVEFDRFKTPSVAYVKREVILSSGAINSPQLLMLSGIGTFIIISNIQMSELHRSEALTSGRTFTDELFYLLLIVIADMRKNEDA